jgi:penicillin-binding protein 1A
MASRKKTRIEPSFSESGRKPGLLDLALGREDRAQPVRGKARKAKGASGGRKPGPRRGRFGRAFGAIAYWGLICAIWGGIVVAGVVAWYGARMPSATSWAIPDRPPNVKILAVNGRLLANRGMTGGEAIGLHDMSPYIPQAVIAIEDRRFYSHVGVDPVGLARAVATNIASGSMVQGGSTLTQQLAKNLFLKPERTLERKVQEVLLAFWLESKYSKDQILEMYLNRVYFGSGAYGVEAASRRYFRKPARDVSLSEAALLAGLLKAPSRLSPARDPKAANERSELVLAAMREQGMISDKELTTAMGRPPTKAATYWTGSEHYVADRVMLDLPQLAGNVKEDLIVDTTVDLTLQKIAEKTVRRLIQDKGKAKRVSQGALVSIDGSGAIRALVGGYDYANSQFDRATEARRQPGSTFKPFVYLAALEQGRTPDSERNDAPVKIGKWSPDNYREKYYGKVTLTTALAKSLNSVAAQLAQEVGPQTVADTAYRMGISSNLAANDSLALGTSEVTLLELTSAYVPLANGGYRPPVHVIKRVTTASGKVLYEYREEGAARVISPEVAGMMNHMMQETLKVGTGKSADFGWPAGGKTGTSQQSRDAWFVGYTANLVTGVWFGNDDGKPTKGVTGGSLPAEAWREFMGPAHDGVSVAKLPGTWTQDSWTASVPRETHPGDADIRLMPAEEQAPVKEANGSGHPVPPAEIGEQQPRRKRRTLFDMLSGN